MRYLILCLMFTAACVPTTRYAYVPPSSQAVVTANSGDAIPLVHNAIALCWPDGTTQLVRDAVARDGEVCAEVRVPSQREDDDGRECFSFADLAGIGIPYESHSLSVIPMATVQVSKCNPDALKRAAND
ncbi:MAG: hypothetical protein HRT80_01340 [Henriciella sp.]|nr:hypothetical protein [Henriciella sp.]